MRMKGCFRTRTPCNSVYSVVFNLSFLSTDVTGFHGGGRSFRINTPCNSKQLQLQYSVVDYSWGEI